ncbi:MAG: DUF4870 domain-containing protein [Acidobacteriaceae bacterium]
MARFCSACGAEVADNAAFCAKCGKSTGVGAPATSAGGAATGAAPASAAGLQDNVAGLLSYFLIPAIIFLVMEPYNRNRFIRFHAFQGIFYAIAWFVAGVIAGFLPILNLLLIPLVGLAFLIGWVILAVKAFQGQKFKLPVIGELAEKQANQ